LIFFKKRENLQKINMKKAQIFTKKKLLAKKNEEKIVLTVKTLKNSVNNIKSDLDSLKKFAKNTLNSLPNDPIFEKLQFLIKNSEDIGKLKTEYLKEIQEKKQFF